MKSAQCAIALGSNLGDSRQILEQAIITLSQTPGILVKCHSRWYETAPIGPPQPNYLNGCAVVETGLSPEDLLESLLAIEQQFGRLRLEKWGPRTLDLDLLLYDDLIWASPRLNIPHPRMAERAFVLVPLAEIAPDWIEPISQQTIVQLLDKVGCSGILNAGNAINPYST